MKRQRKTDLAILIVGEGSTEKAFLHHLKDIYNAPRCGVGVKIMSAQGGSPQNIVRFTIKQCRWAAYDEIFVWMDKDVPWGEAEEIARQHNPVIQLIGSTPCREGLLLRIIDQKIQGKSSAECKRLLKKKIGDKLTDRSNYKNLFTQSQLNKKRSTIPELDKLIRCMSPRETSA